MSGFNRLSLRLLGLRGSPLDTHHALRERREQVLRWIILSLILGVLTGALVAVFDYLLRDQAVWFLYKASSDLVYLLLPVVGLTLANLVVRYLVPAREGSLTEAYIRTYHHPAQRLSLRDLPGKLLASAVTIASGGSLGLEGPAIFMGSSLGDAIQRRYERLFRREDVKLLLVAGAAAGMAAIFKAPLTGIIFSLGAPYKDGLGGRALVPSLVASASSYITFVLLVGSEPFFAVAFPHEFGLVEILLSVLLGLLCGIGARFFVVMTHGIQRAFERIPKWLRPPLAGLAVGCMGVLVFHVFGEPYIYGPGYRCLRHVIQGSDPASLLVLLFFAKAVATSFSMTGGGVGGVFFPQALMGATLGAFFGQLVGGASAPLYPLMGTAAFVGAGYRTPLAAVAFVAETTGSPWALIPAMLATVVSYLAMGRSGISEEQR